MLRPQMSQSRRERRVAAWGRLSAGEQGEGGREGRGQVAAREACGPRLSAAPAPPRGLTVHASGASIHPSQKATDAQKQALLPAARLWRVLGAWCLALWDPIFSPLRLPLPILHHHLRDHSNSPDGSRQSGSLQPTFHSAARASLRAPASRVLLPTHSLLGLCTHCSLHEERSPPHLHLPNTYSTLNLHLPNTSLKHHLSWAPS